MKSSCYVFVVAAFLCGLATTAHALEPVEKDAPPQWTVQVDPLTTALGFVHVQVERALAPQWSVYVGPHLRLFDSPLLSEQEGVSEEAKDFKGYGLEAGLRWFFEPTAPQGWWLQVRGVGAYLVGPNETGAGGYASALGGHTWILGDVFVLAAGLGGQYLHYQVEGAGPKGVLPAAHTTFGFAF